MMDSWLTRLPWLANPPPDLRQRLRTLSGASQESRAAVRQLAACSLSVTQLQMVGDAIAKVSIGDENVSRLGILSNGTVDLILPSIAASSLRHGVWVRAIGAAFNQVAAEALNPQSAINESRCHFVLLCIDHRGLPLVPTPGDLDRASRTIEASLGYVESLRSGLHNASGCTVIVQTIPQVASNSFGSLERNLPGTLQWLIDNFNRELRATIRGSSDLLLDTAALAETVGLAEWHDPVQWTLGKFQFSQAIVPLYADWVGRLIGAARGRTRKCLVLDLDNTLWGGVIGDDGLAGIILGNGSPVGEAYLRVQETVLALRNRGVVLAVSSKNDARVARLPFQSHPEMLLKDEHISIFMANWHDKSSNIKAIAEALNFGLDALVFLDDNPAERALVREEIPSVAVPELPPDPAYYSDTLLAAGYFDSITFTAEDRLRADHYRADSARAELLRTDVDLDSYLRSLEMRAFCAPFDRVGRARITQLINKTNQFNLTTRRYTEAEVERFEADEMGLTLQLRLVDRFGDNGIVSVIICITRDQEWIIDTWLMSCRVLGRKVERAALKYVVDRASLVGVKTLVGQYIRSDRNGMVRDHYANLGFVRSYSDESSSRWTLDVMSYSAEPVPIEIIDAALPSAKACDSACA